MSNNAHAKNFKATELEANHAQAVNLVINRSFDLDSKLKQFSDLINQKLERYLVNNNQETPIVSKINHIQHHQPINSGNKKCMLATIVQLQTPPLNQAQMTSRNFRSRVTQNWKLAMVVHQPISSSSNQPTGSHFQNSETGHTLNPNFQHYLSLLIIPEDALSNNVETNQTLPFTSNISPAIITNDKSLVAIFLFKLEKLLFMLLFNKAALEKKLITTIYTDIKVDGHFIKLILDSRSADTDEATKTPIGEIDDLSIEINDIIVLIKVLVMEAIQYQALVGNNWLSKINTTLDWFTQELQLSQNSQYICVPATCGHFKPITMSSASLIKFNNKEKKPTWEAY
ncbi:hypothetical protein G9A89_004334 [Geosiphon pyriformis]|nr:hypothetical protein G9A89_004334 [Geosiphon pyriformis]